MPKPRTNTGCKNLIANNLICLRAKNGLSQRDLAQKLQLAGYDIDKNVITRIETQKRYVTDIEIKAICEICLLLQIDHFQPSVYMQMNVYYFSEMAIILLVRLTNFHLVVHMLFCLGLFEQDTSHHD